MRFCVVELSGQSSPMLAVQRDGGVVTLDAPASLRGALDRYGDMGLIQLGRNAAGPSIPFEKITRWLPPVPDPRSFRDFYAFEQHVKTCRTKRGQGHPTSFYDGSDELPSL